MHEMIFEDVHGSPVPKLPHRGDGTMRVADGVRTLTLAQAMAHFKWTEEQLRDLYSSTFADVAGIVGGLSGAAKTAAPNVAGEKPVAVIQTADMALKEELLRAGFYPQLLPEEFKFFLEICQHRSIDPWARRVVPEIRNGLNGERQIVLITTVEQLRIIADRTGKYTGQTAPEWRGESGQWLDFWAEDAYPSGARVGVTREGFAAPAWGIVKWEEMVQIDEGGQVAEHWAKMPALMLAKCAEASALRKAFPDDCGGLYLREELREQNRMSRGLDAGGGDSSDDIGEGRRIEPDYDQLPPEEASAAARKSHLRQANARRAVAAAV